MLKSFVLKHFNSGKWMDERMNGYMMNGIWLGRRFGRFKSSFICCKFEAKFLHAKPTLMFVHKHFYQLTVRLIIWVCSRKIEAVFLAAFVFFLSPVMHYLDRNSNRDNTITRYKAIIQLIKTHVNLWTFIHFCWQSFGGCL